MYKIKKIVKTNICRIVANGDPCQEPVRTNGLCNKHYSNIQNRGELHKYSFPPPNYIKQDEYRKENLKINEQAKRRFCRLIIGGIKCNRKSKYRGLCSPCANRLKGREILKDFALPKMGSYKYKNLTVNPYPDQGYCRTLFSGVACPRKIRWRGLCTRCIIKHRKNDLLEKFALPKGKSKRQVYTVKKNVDINICRILVDGKPCLKSVSFTGLCDAHYSNIQHRKELDLYASTIPRRKRQYDYRKDNLKINRQPKEGLCRLIVGGKECNRQSKSRGICGPCRINLKNDWLLDTFALPSKLVVEKMSVAAHLRINKNPIKGRCHLIIDGKRCHRKNDCRGLCKSCQENLNQRNLLNKFSLPHKK